jgi:hypothetical protein
MGNKWVGTSGGVSEFDGTNWITYTTADGLSNNNVNAVAIDLQGNKWFGFGFSGGGVSKFDGTNWTSYTTADGLGSNSVYSIYIDAKGNKWFGFGDSGYGVTKLEDGSATTTSSLEKNKTSTGLSAYPNPSINETTLIFPQSDKYNLMVTDLNGRTVKQFAGLTGENALISTTDIAPGIYLISLKSLTNGNTYKGKIVVAR